MKRLIYKAVKVTSATIIAIMIAEFMGLHYASTAGIIALLVHEM